MLPNPLPDSYTLLTAIGAAKLANAFATSTPLVITEFAIGDANGSAYTPPIDSNDYVTQTELVNEVYRDNILQKAIDPADPTLVKIRCQIPSDEGGYTIREVGLFDDDGDMIAIMINEQYKPAAGSGSTISVMNLTFLLHVANTATVTLGYTVAEYTDFSASTNTPPIASLTPGNSFLVITAGRLTGVAISGAIAGSDSVVLAGDIIKNINGQLQLVSREINTATTIPCGTGGLFTTLGAANTYINQRRLTAVVSLDFNGTSTTTETSSININHVDGANLKILGTSAHTTFDFSGTPGNNLTISCDCYVEMIDVKSNVPAAEFKAALQIHGSVTHNNISGVNLSTGLGIGLLSGNLTATSAGITNGTANVTASTSSISNVAIYSYGNSKLVAYNLVSVGIVGGGNQNNSMYIFNNFTASGFSPDMLNIIVNGATTISGIFQYGLQANCRFNGVFSCGSFNAGINSQYYFGSSATCTTYSAGVNCNLYFSSTFNCSQYDGGVGSSSFHSGNVTNTGSHFSGTNSTLCFNGTYAYTGQYGLGSGSATYHAQNVIPTSGTYVANTGQIYFSTANRPTGYTGTTNTTLGN